MIIFCSVCVILRNDKLRSGKGQLKWKGFERPVRSITLVENADPELLLVQNTGTEFYAYMQLR